MTEVRGSLVRRRWVVKIGSALLTNDGLGLDRDSVAIWVEQIANLVQRGIDIVLVSSGSVAEGMSRLGWTERPAGINQLQAAAAIGQMGLVQVYESCFQRHRLHTAQVLLTHDDIANRVRYLNARSTLRTLLDLHVVPVVNENDTVATDEIRFGDNDTLAGLVANLVEAECLVILTDQEGLYDADPRQYPGANLIGSALAGDPSLEGIAGDGGILGRGGMRTKLRAAELAARSGTCTVIAAGRADRVLTRLADGQNIGTRLSPSQPPLAARKRWLAGQMTLRGRLVLDDGAVRVLRSSGRSLLSVGVSAVEGRFERGDIVSCLDSRRGEVARGLVNYNAEDTRKIMGKPSVRIAELLGYMEEPELIHRDNLVLIAE